METVLHSALPLEVSNEGMLQFVWNLLLKVVRRDELSREESDSVRLIREGAESFGLPILAATSQQDLKDRFADVVEGSAFHPYLQRVMGMVLAMDDGTWKAHANPRSAANFREVLQTVLSGGAISTFEQGLKYLETSARVMPPVMEQFRAEGSELDKALSMSPMDFIYHQDVPTELAEAFYESQCGMAVSFALNAAILRGQKLEPWLGMALAERWSRGHWNDLRILSLDAAIAREIPENVLPLAERFDLEAMNARQEKVQQSFRALNEAAERAGEPVYPAKP